MDVPVLGWPSVLRGEFPPRHSFATGPLWRTRRVSRQTKPRSRLVGWRSVARRGRPKDLRFRFRPKASSTPLCGRSLPQQVVNALPRKTGLRSNPSDRHVRSLSLPAGFPQLLGRLSFRLVGLCPLFDCGLNAPDCGRLAHCLAASLTRAWNMERCPWKRLLWRHAYSSR